MSNQQQQGGGAQQPGQPGQQIAPGLQAIPQLMVPPAARPILSGAPVVAGPGNPVTLTPQQLLLAQQQQQLLQAHFLQQMSQNPQLASMMRAQQQQALQAAQALKPGQFAPARLPMPALALAQTQAPGLKTAPPTTALAAAGQQAGGLKRASSSAGTGASGGKKRKAAELRLPDKPYHILPESPLFVEIQDVERRVDQAITKKRAELQELYVGLSRGETAPGRAKQPS